MRSTTSRIGLIGLLLAIAALAVTVIARHSAGGVPDLAFRSIVLPRPLPPALRAGGSVTIDVEYAEIAGVALDAGATFETALFLSTDPRIEPGDVPIGRARVTDGVAPGGIGRLRLTATVPRGTAPGVYFVGAIVDAGDEVPEAADDNNVTGTDEVKRVEVMPAALSAEVYDLFLDAAAWTGLCYDFEDKRIEVAPGARLHAEARPANLGGRKPGAYELAYYASKDTTITTADALLGKVTVEPPATPYGHTTPALTLIVPELEANTVYYCGAIVDAGDVLSEASETNNVSTLMAFTVVERDEAAVDLSVPECDHPDVSHIEAGQIHHLPHVVAAIGSIDPGPFAVRYFLDSDGDGRIETDGDDLEIGSQHFPAGMDLDSHPDVVVVGSVRVPAEEVEPGAYRVGVVVDPDDSVRERDEENNTCISPDEVQIGHAETAPDLVVALTDADTLVFDGRIHAHVGAQFPVQFTLLANRGGRAVQDAIVVSYFVSADAAVDTPDDDHAVGSHVVSSGLGAGLRRVIEAVPVDLKELSAGRYHLFAVVDPADAIVEEDDENNDSATADLGDGPAGFVEVVVSSAPPLPDLAVLTMEDFSHHIYSGRDSRVSAFGDVINASTALVAGPSIASLWVSTNDDPRIGEGDVHLDSVPFGFLGPLAVGGCEFYVKTGFDPDREVPYHLKLVVDSLGEVEEGDEGNNMWVGSPFFFR